MTTRRLPGWLTPPPPDVAIEIASGRVTVAEIGRGANGAVVSSYASETLPPEAVAPALTGANIPAVDVVAAALRRALERAGLKAPRRAALVIPDAAARVSILGFEQLPPRPADRDQLIRWQLRKATPFPLEEARLSYETTGTDASGVSVAVVLARHDVIAQYEAVTSALGIHAGLVDLASFNVMNLVIAGGAAPATDWLLVCLAADSTSLAILRGRQLMFYRNRASSDQEPLSALVHQVAMFHEDRLGGSTFARVLVSGRTFAVGGAEALRRDISDRLQLAADPVDLRLGAELRDRITPAPEVLDALAAPIGLLLRERKVA